MRSPRDYPSLFGKKGPFTAPVENSPRSTPELPVVTSPLPTTAAATTSVPTNTPAPTTDDGKPTEGRKSTKLSNSFIRKQNSAKKIQQKVSKTHKIESDSGREPLHKREHSASSRKSLIRKDTDNIQLDKKLSLEVASSTPVAATPISSSNSEVKLPPLQSINEGISTKPPKEETDQTPRNSQGETPNNTRARRSVRVHEEIPGVPKQPQQPAPLTARAALPQTNTVVPSPGKPSLFRSTTIGSAISSALGRSNSLVASNPKFLENNENVPPLPNNIPEPPPEKESTSPRHNNNKITLPDVFQKVNELERKFSGKERALELEQAGLKKQVEEMRVSLDTLVLVITTLTEKITT